MKQKSGYESISNLLVQICKHRRNKSNALLSDAGIYGGQDILLYYLSMEDGQTVSSLVEKMCIRQATISTMIDRMQANGMIRKEKDRTDKRTSRIFITNQGKEAYKKIAKIWTVMEKTLTNGLDAKQQETLRNLLKIVLKNIN